MLHREGQIQDMAKRRAWQPGVYKPSHPGDLNPKPDAYEASALPIELGWRLDKAMIAVYYIQSVGICKS